MFQAQSIPFILFILLLGVSASAQITFSIVCNQSSNKVEILDSRDIASHHTLIKENLPTREAATQWKQDHHPSDHCGTSAPPNTQRPPTTAGPPPAAPPTTHDSGQNAPSQTLENTTVSYNRAAALKIIGSYTLGIDEYVDFFESSEKIGYGIEGELFLGRKVKYGLGFGYISLYEDEFAERFNLFRTRALIKVPIRIGLDSWFLVDVFIDYHYDNFVEGGEDFLGAGLGFTLDMHGLLFGLRFSAHGGPSFIDSDDSMFLPQVFVGYSF